MIRTFRLVVTAAIVTIASGCGGWQGMVVRQASFDHNCPEDQVRVLRDNGDRMARAVWVDACGRERIYRDIGGAQAYVFQDMTEAQDGM